MGNKAKIIEHLRQAWDALEGLPCLGYSARARIQTAQEAILAVYNEINQVEPDDGTGPEKEGGDGSDD